MTARGLYIGLMSGTSMDGIDAALVGIDEMGRPELLQALNHPWPDATRRRLGELCSLRQAPLEELGQLDRMCGEAFAAAAARLLQESGRLPRQITAIGSHGQTLYHHPHPPAPFTLQIGDPNVIAQRTGITTVADFRRRDMAAGGQGAPLVPLLHREVFHHPQRNRTILNIGGIANLTRLPAKKSQILGFDCGPGNCLMDAWVRHCLEQPFDRNGAWAESGQVNQRLLEVLLADDYYRTPPPKSTGTEHFSLDYLQQRLASFPPLKAEDVQATLLTLTVESIAASLEQWCPGTKEVLVCGGGSHNRGLMRQLATRLESFCVKSTLEEGIDPDWVEAMAFAWLAARTLAGEPGNLPAVTGATAAVVLGGIYPAG